VQHAALHEPRHEALLLEIEDPVVVCDGRARLLDPDPDRDVTELLPHGMAGAQRREINGELRTRLAYRALGVRAPGTRCVELDAREHGSGRTESVHSHSDAMSDNATAAGRTGSRTIRGRCACRETGPSPVP